jgi:hypothetical protein
MRRSTIGWILALVFLVGFKIATGGGHPLPYLLAGAALVVAFFARAFAWLDGWRTLLLLLGISGLYSVYPALAGDGIEYYALLRSPLFDHDLDLSNDFEGFSFHPLTTPEGRPVARQGAGVALCWLPLVVATHLGLGLANTLGARVPRDGFALPYQTAATVSTFLYGFLALLLLEGALRRLYGAAIAALTVIAAYLATPLHFYLVANPFMSHGASVFAATGFVLAWLRARTGEDPGEFLVAGAWGGLMALVRSHDTVLLLMPLLDLWSGRASRRLRLTGALLLAPALMGLLQAFVWWRLYGASFLSGVLRINRVHGLALHPVEVLLSPRHGLLVWSPLWGVAILGILLWIRRNAPLALLFVIGLASTVLLNSLFEDWWGSQSFGQRRLLSLLPILAFGLAEALLFLRQRPLVPVALCLASLVAWNLEWEQIYNSDLVAEKWQAVSLDALAAAQVDLVYRRVLTLEGRVPPALFSWLYDLLKGVWLDEGPRSLKGRVALGETPPVPFLIGDGWYRPETEGGVSFRKTRGRRSALRLPIHTPGDFRATLRARLEEHGEAVDLSLDVNGEDCGTLPLSPGWQDYGFTVPGRALHSGINTVVLRFSSTPRKSGEGGKNAVLAVESATFKRLEAAPPEE